MFFDFGESYNKRHLREGDFNTSLFAGRLNYNFSRSLFPGPDEIISMDDTFYGGRGGCGSDAEQVLSREYDVAVDMLCTKPCVEIMHRISARTKVGINFAPDEPSPYSIEIQPFSAVEDRSAIDCYLDYARALQFWTRGLETLRCEEC